jgi:isopentenyl diphosphate isomerase/L-lactate dehydrogenase-like FMN-dependent dehydrogenase
VIDDPAAVRTMHAIVDAARARLDDEVWDYLAGGTETDTTLRRNRLGIDSLALRPRVLRDVSDIDPRGSLLGQTLRMPVVMAPLGAVEMMTPAGGAAAARAAERCGLMAVASSVAAPSLEEVAAASAAPKSAQLYIRGDAAWADALIDRVTEAGYVAVTLTVDTAYYSHRERQMRADWLPPSHRDVLADLGWQARLDWDWVDRMRERTPLPFVLKGIQTAQDAELALDRGIEVIWISNHGGRQLDHGQATIETLREVVDVVGGRAEIVVDGGFLRGTDILKAVALGADAVALGRFQGLALAAGGEDALVRALELLEAEIRTSMGLLGVSRLAELDAGFVSRAPALPAASPLLAAFPPVGDDWPGPASR